jgi:hypothetical protein
MRKYVIFTLALNQKDISWRPKYFSPALSAKGYHKETISPCMTNFIYPDFLD